MVVVQGVKVMSVGSQVFFLGVGVGVTGMWGGVWDKGVCRSGVG